MAKAEQVARILVVDDSRVMRESIKRFLKSGEYECVEARDGQEAWATLNGQKEAFDLMITDIAMPRMDGYNLIVKVRDSGQTPELARIPIIVITGVEDEVTRMRAFACGADSFITKPLAGEDLRKNVQAMLQRKPTAQPRQRGRATLANQQTLMLQGEETLARCREENSAMAVVVMDLSDSDGKEPGKELHERLTETLLQTLRDTDLLAPVGKKRFAIIADETDATDVSMLTRRLREALERAFPGQTAPPVMGHAAMEEIQDGGFRALLDVAVKRCDEGGNATPVDIDESVLARPGIEEALEMLRRNEPGLLLAYAGEMAARTLPLLEYCNEQFELGLEYELASIREKLREMN